MVEVWGLLFLMKMVFESSYWIDLVKRTNFLDERGIGYETILQVFNGFLCCSVFS